MASIRFLHTNDLHGKLSRSRMPALLEARSGVDLYFDTGDCIAAGNLAIPLSPDPVWGLLAEANCDGSVPGNRESHILDKVVQTKFSGVSHPVLCANWIWNDGRPRWERSQIFERNGLKIGVFGVMVPMVTARMATRHASQFLWSAPIDVAKQVVENLRGEVDVLIALTHIGYSPDEKLAEACPALDIIFGGHSHTILESPVKVNNTWIAQGGSHGRYLGIYEWENGVLRGGLKPWEVENT